MGKKNDETKGMVVEGIAGLNGEPIDASPETDLPACTFSDVLNGKRGMVEGMDVDHIRALLDSYAHSEWIDAKERETIMVSCFLIAVQMTGMSDLMINRVLKARRVASLNPNARKPFVAYRVKAIGPALGQVMQALNLGDALRLKKWSPVLLQAFCNAPVASPED